MGTSVSCEFTAQHRRKTAKFQGVLVCRSLRRDQSSLRYFCRSQGSIRCSSCSWDVPNGGRGGEWISGHRHKYLRWSSGEEIWWEIVIQAREELPSGLRYQLWESGIRTEVVSIPFWQTWRKGRKIARFAPLLCTFADGCSWLATDGVALMDLRTEEPEVANVIIEKFKAYLKEYDIDGVRWAQIRRKSLFL